MSYEYPVVTPGGLTPREYRELPHVSRTVTPLCKAVVEHPLPTQEGLEKGLQVPMVERNGQEVPITAILSDQVVELETTSKAA